jgi:hypothetical protein
MEQKLRTQPADRRIRRRLDALGVPGSFRFTFDFPSSRYKWRRVLAFRRSWILIAIVMAMDMAFTLPAVSTFGQAMEKWHALHSLFDLTSAVFLTGWVIAWSLAPLILTLILLLMLTGREVLIGRSGILQIGFGVPGFMLSVFYDARKIANLRLSDPDSKAGTAWRGTYITFDYDDAPVQFGSAMTEPDLQRIKQAIEALAQDAPNAVADRMQPIVRPRPAVLSAQRNAHTTDGETGPVTLVSPSTLALIASNLVPVVGALYFGWRLSDVMVLYWAESAVIALFNVAKIAFIGRWMAVLTCIYFLAHFSAFMAMHFLIIYDLFVKGQHDFANDDLATVANLFVSLWPALMALLISHGISFVMNFIGNKEYLNITVRQQMAAPYARVVLMHVTLIIGGFIVQILHDPAAVLLLFILIKIFIDVDAHTKEHNAVVAPR